MEPILTRRRFLTISAAAAALPARAGVPETARWRGQALGAGASMTLAGLDEAAAAPVFAAVEAELARLEKIFSLYREDSDLSRLNRTGNLTAPPLEMLEVLALSDRLNRATGGAFDPSVQPLWQALAAGRGLDDRARAGWEHVHFDAGEVRLARPGMALTFNGIAQGYITDRIAALLAVRGADRSADRHGRGRGPRPARRRRRLARGHRPARRAHPAATDAHRSRARHLGAARYRARPGGTHGPHPRPADGGHGGGAAARLGQRAKCRTGRRAFHRLLPVDRRRNSLGPDPVRGCQARTSDLTNPE